MSESLPSTRPDIRLFGTVDEQMVSEFLRQQAEAPTDRAVVLELWTLGGDADAGRRIAQEVRQWQRAGQELYFFGKSNVYSAGISIMAAFRRERRFLSKDCELLIHERKLQQELQLQGALRSCATQVKNMLAEIESGQRLERDGFAELVEGASITLDDLQARVWEKDWYLTAAEAEQLRLVAGLAA